MSQKLWRTPGEWGGAAAEVLTFRRINTSCSPRSMFKSLLTATHEEYIQHFDNPAPTQMTRARVCVCDRGLTKQLVLTTRQCSLIFSIQSHLKKRVPIVAQQIKDMTSQ